MVPIITILLVICNSYFRIKKHILKKFKTLLAVHPRGHGEHRYFKIPIQINHLEFLFIFQALRILAKKPTDLP